MNKTIDAQDAMELVLAQMRLLGIDLGQLADYSDQNPSAVGAVTMGEFIVETVMPSLKKGQRQAYKPYAKLVIDGLPKLCACFCSKCLQSFKGD